MFIGLGARLPVVQYKKESISRKQLTELFQLLGLCPLKLVWKGVPYYFIANWLQWNIQLLPNQLTLSVTEARELSKFTASFQKEKENPSR